MAQLTQPEVDAFSVDQLWDAEGLSTNACSCLNVSGLCTPCELFVAELPFRYECPSDCLHCKDKGPEPGRVWALPGMQEKCTYVARIPSLNHRKCMACHGTGWVAKRDLATLWAALPQEWMVDATKDDSSRSTVVSVLIPLYAEADTYISQSADIEKALLRAVAQALVAQGAIVVLQHHPPQ